MKNHTVRFLCLAGALVLASTPLAHGQVVPTNPDPDPFGDRNEDEYLDTLATGRWWDLATYPPASYYTGGLFFNSQAPFDMVRDQPRDETLAFALYTHDFGVLKLTAQLYPLKEGESMVTWLDLDFGSGWTNVASEAVEYPGWFARYRIENWDNTQDIPYRVRHKASAAYNENSYEGLIRHDPVEKDTIVVAVAGGLGQTWTDPLQELVDHILAEDPDLVVFNGDQYYVNYEHTAGWLNFGLQMKELFRERPVVCLLDDHDYSQGNIWGNGGMLGSSRSGESGGFFHSPDFVNMVQTAMASHMPDPYDPTPLVQGTPIVSFDPPTPGNEPGNEINVYYTRLRVGGIDFALLEDRKWKSGYKNPTNTVYNSDKITDTNLDTLTLDQPGLVLLGQRQLDFLRDWGQDWTGTEMKAVLSQTAFACVPHIHSSTRQVANLDANGWPQTPRNNAVRELRRALAIHISGDQHLATVVQYGIDEFGDAPYNFATPAGRNSIFHRYWHPLGETNGPNPRAATTLPWTGDYLDGFQNRISMLAYANPGDGGVTDRREGFAMVRFHKPERQITMEAWDRYLKDAEVLVPAAAAAAAPAALAEGVVGVSNLGASAPAADIIAQNLAQTTAGNRPVDWHNATTHSLIGQSFTATRSATLEGISLKLDSAENFAAYDAASFRLKLFQGNNSSATLLGTYAYDATGVGSAAVGDWIRFGLGSGVALSSGTVYSFLMVNGVENANHITSFERTKVPEDYIAGTELRAGNSYDIANWETDPWDVVAGATQDDVAPQAGHLLFVVDGPDGGGGPTGTVEVVTGRWQFPGWPVTIDMEDNDGRAVTHVLPEMVFAGVTDPVVQVERESDGDILYTLRIPGDTWTPKVYAAGTYTVKVGTDRPDQQTFTGIAAVPADSDDARSVTVSM